MRIERIEIRKIFLPFRIPFVTSHWIQDGNNSIIIRIDAEGITGWGESPVSIFPYYTEETTGTAWSVLKEILIPLLLKQKIQIENFSIENLFSCFSGIIGNRIAIAGLEFAIWDLAGKMKNKSLSQILGGVKKKIDVGVSIGIQKDISSLLNSVENFLSEGYKRIKIKIKPGWDLEPVKEIRRRWKNILLQVDANSSYSLNDSMHLSKLDKHHLVLIEQPLNRDDIVEHARLQREIKTPICLDESIISIHVAKSAIEIGACKIINIKPVRVGGLSKAKKIHDLAGEKNIPVWCGGMLETGIGRTFNLALASLPNFELPADISANKRYFKKDIVLNPLELNLDGTISVPEQPGSGAIVDEDFLEKITIEKRTFTSFKPF